MKFQIGDFVEVVDEGVRGIVATSGVKNGSYEVALANDQLVSYPGHKLQLSNLFEVGLDFQVAEAALQLAQAKLRYNELRRQLKSRAKG